MFSGDALDARPEGRAGEQNAISAATYGIVRKRFEALMHALVKHASIGREISRKRIVEQIDTCRVGP